MVQWGGKPLPIQLEQGFVRMLQSLDGFCFEPSALQLFPVCVDKLIYPAKVVQQLDKTRAPEIRGAKSDQPIVLRGDSKPPACTRWSTYMACQL